MAAQLRADVVVGTMITIAQKIDGMDTRLTSGQARLEDRLDHVVKEQVKLRADLAEVKTELKADIAEVKADIAEVKSELRANMAIVTENHNSLNRKLNALLTHMGITE